MKGHDHKMARMEDILNLPVQDPPCAEFSAAHIKWVKVDGGRHGGDDIALIPYARVDDFVKGESLNADCPASFRIESKRKRAEGSVSKPRVDGYLEYTLSFLTNCWYQALQILDVDVIIDEQNLQYAKVISQSDRSVVYTIWNPGSEFSLCDCPWSMLGNLCKHIIKVAILCKSRQVARPLLAAQVYRQALLTLLQNPPDDPVVLDHAILHATRLQQDIKGVEDLSNSGLLQSLHSEVSFLCLSISAVTLQSYREEKFMAIYTRCGDALPGHGELNCIHARPGHGLANLYPRLSCLGSGEKIEGFTSKMVEVVGYYTNNL
ncbi:hypothetical protein ACLB2K_010128 [Fragaria x ananassa]